MCYIKREERLTFHNIGGVQGFSHRHAESHSVLHTTESSCHMSSKGVELDQQCINISALGSENDLLVGTI